MAKDPAFPLYAQDFLSGTAFMTMEERGAYITLLCHQWNVGKIPKKRLGFVLGSNWETLWEVIGEKFKSDGNGFVWNERLETEREKRKAFKEKQRLNGLKGGRPKKEDNPEETQTEPKQKPLEEESDNEKEDGSEGEEEKDFTVEIWPTFDDFWDSYDKKTSRRKCEKKWDKLKQDEKEEIMRHLEAYVPATPDPKYRKNPETYLNNRSWEDEFLPTQNGKHGKRQFTVEELAEEADRQLANQDN